MEPLTEREKFLFMMGYDAGYFASYSGIIEGEIRKIKARDPKADTSLYRFKMAKAIIDEDIEEFQKTASDFAGGVGIDINSVEGMT